MKPLEGARFAGRFSGERRNSGRRFRALPHRVGRPSVRMGVWSIMPAAQRADAMYVLDLIPGDGTETLGNCPTDTATMKIRTVMSRVQGRRAGARTTGRAAAHRPGPANRRGPERTDCGQRGWLLSLPTNTRFFLRPQLRTPSPYPPDWRPSRPADRRANAGGHRRLARLPIGTGEMLQGDRRCIALSPQQA